ncbi:2-C-methyl-D-erythritol 4-phosphate cytidylyltransferase [Calidifontibacter terrae]
MSDAHDLPIVGVVVVAAGMGTRLGAGIPKALVAVDGEPLVVHAMRAIGAMAHPHEVVVVVPPTHRAQFAQALSGARLVDGGAERTDSVAAGLAALGPAVQIVLVHDAARAFAPAALFDRVVAAVGEGADAVVPGLPVVDTIKEVDGDDVVTATADRARLRAVQTPQGFRRAALEKAHAGGASATDDAALVERAGGSVRVVPGDPLAHKVTTPADLERLQVPAATPELIVLAGLPGVGKSTIARALATRLRAAYVRVDTIEQAMRDSGEIERPSVGGYAVGYAVTADQLSCGVSVVADSVNPLEVTRSAWRQVADHAGARVLEVEIVCSDETEHERRVTDRIADIAGLVPPTWGQVMDHGYADHEPDLQIDSAASGVAESVDQICAALRRTRR